MNRRGLIGGLPLAAAGAVFPHAGAMGDAIDWCALQGAIDRAIVQGGAAVHLPNGGRCSRIYVF